MAKGINMRSRLVEHYKHHYPASLMRMAIISNHSLNTMTQIVAGLFTDIPTVPHTPPFRCLEGDQAGPEWQQHFLYLESRKEGEALKLRFPMEESAFGFPCVHHSCFTANSLALWNTVRVLIGDTRRYTFCL